MAARLLLRRFLVGNSEYGLPAELMGTLEAHRTGSAGSELAGNARALCHVSAKKLVGETQYSMGPAIAPLLGHCHH